MNTRLNRPPGMPVYFLGRDLVTWRAALAPRQGQRSVKQPERISAP
ncbi:MAG TPA: hypothetical protein VJ782_08455 [Aeromicrobium sp.]|nr:hypothetical protein [Aeromicrobium sp.]